MSTDTTSLQVAAPAGIWECMLKRRSGNSVALPAVELVILRLSCRRKYGNSTTQATSGECDACGVCTAKRHRTGAKSGLVSCSFTPSPSSTPVPPAVMVAWQEARDNLRLWREKGGTRCSHDVLKAWAVVAPHRGSLGSDGGFAALCRAVLAVRAPRIPPFLLSPGALESYFWVGVNLCVCTCVHMCSAFMHVNACVLMRVCTSICLQVGVQV